MNSVTREKLPKNKGAKSYKRSTIVNTMLGFVMTENSLLDMTAIFN